ncbi:MAG: HINT domain-containing protein [Candidatus Accumulibacter sp.]|jgi:hypothetical protein|nr:HINT domain-containing protein [Accumulibacter sp.]
MGRNTSPLGAAYPPPIPFIDATDEHPFWVQGKAWVPVRDLQPGDEFMTYDGDPTFVDRIESCGMARVFNLEIEDFHTYFVDFVGIWVHNQPA